MSVTERQAEAINRAVAGREPGRLTAGRLWVGGVPVVYSELGWDAVGSNYGMALRATVRNPGGTLDLARRAALKAEVVFEEVVAGISVERFTGTLSNAAEARAPSGRPSGSWQIVAATRGDSIEEKELGELVSWDQAPPHLLVKDALGRCGYTGPVRVEEVEEPEISLKGSASLPSSASPADEFAAVEAEVPAYEFFDVPGDGHDAFLRTPPAEIVEPAFVFDASRLSGWLPVREEPRVAWVAVRRSVEPPEPLEDPYEELARLPVPGSMADPDTVEWIDSSDRSAFAVERAFQTCRDRAAELADYTPVAFTGPVHPLLSRGSGVWVVERGTDHAGAYRQTWAVYLHTLKGTHPSKKTTYEGLAALLAEVREPRRVAPMPPATPGVVAAGNLAA